MRSGVIKVNIHIHSPAFTFKLSKPKGSKRNTNKSKIINNILYAEAIKTDKGELKAVVNTKGLGNDYADKTIVSFTENSFNIVERTNVFYYTKDDNNHYTRIIRSSHDAKYFPGNKETYTPICEYCVYSGYLVKVDDILKFDMATYIGDKSHYSHLLINKTIKEK